MRISQYKQYIFGFLLFLIFVLTLYLLKGTAKPDTQNIKTQEAQPHSVMEDVIATRIDKSGKIESKLYTPKMIMYPEQDRIELSKPRLEVFNVNGKPWDIRAEHGLSTQKVDKVDLWEKVKIHQPSDSNNNGSTLLTNSLTIIPKEKFAHTEDPVTLLQPGMMIKATGLNAFMNTGKMDLISDAEGEYETAHPQSTKTN